MLRPAPPKHRRGAVQSPGRYVQARVGGENRTNMDNIHRMRYRRVTATAATHEQVNTSTYGSRG
jgi:hypothetical protein